MERSRWFGQAERKEDRYWANSCGDLVVEGVKGKGRGRYRQLCRERHAKV